MLKDLIARLFCREVGRRLRRLGMLGAVFGAFLAIYVELPLGIAIATREAQAEIAALDLSLENAVARLKHHELGIHEPQPHQTSRNHLSKPNQETH
jgi:hypothetical protein